MAISLTMILAFGLSLGALSCRSNVASNVKEDASLSPSPKAYIRTLNREVRAYNWTTPTKRNFERSYSAKGLGSWLERSSGLDDGNSPLLQKVTEASILDDYENNPMGVDWWAMGKGFYFAFSPTESLSFGIPQSWEERQDIAPEEAMDRGILRSFILPKGSTYVSVSDPLFIEEADRLVKSTAEKCSFLTFSTLKVRILEKVDNLAEVQGLFRSCPNLKRILLSDALGQPINFVLFPETPGGAYSNREPYATRLPASTIAGEAFMTQGKARWAILVSTPRENSAREIFDESLHVWAPALPIPPGDEKSIKSRSLLHCAVEFGSTQHRKRKPWTDFAESEDLSDIAIADRRSYAETLGIGSLAQELTHRFQQWYSQPYFQAMETFKSATRAEGRHSSAYTSDGRNCPSVEQMAHHQGKIGDDFRMKFKNAFLQSESGRPLFESFVCPLIAPTIATGIRFSKSNPVALLSRAGGEDLESYIENSRDPRCLELYSQFFEKIVPMYAKVVEDCRDLLAKVGQPQPLILPESKCDESARREILQTSFLSQETHEEDAPNDLGDTLEFLAR